MVRRGAAGAIILSSLAWGGAAQAAEWWVDQAAASGGDGSESQPFQTINEVKAVLTTGDTVWIRDGVYAETVDFWHVPQGAGERTTLRAAPGHAPIIDGGGAQGFVLQAGETSHMTFQGLTVRNGSTAFLFYYADHGEVIDCTTESVGGAVAFYHASYGHVSGSDLEGSVSGKESDGTVIEDNEIWGSGAEGITLHAHSTNCRFSRNVVHDNHAVNIYLDSISHSVVDSNLVYMSPSTTETTVGIMLADESYDNVTAPVLTDIVITNNVVIHNESGIRFWDGHFAGQSALRNVVIANNTVVNNETSAIKWDAGPHQNTVVQNNIFAAESGAGLLMLQANSTDGITLDHNLWHLPDIASPFLWGTTAYDHAGWTTATGHGEGDVLAAPDFAGSWELPVQNLELLQTSPAVDVGVTVAEVTHDFAGGQRPAGEGYDLGAFEYGAAPGGAGGGGTGGSGTGGAGADSTGGSGGTAATPWDSEDDEGCGCRLASRNEQSPWKAGLLLAVGLGWARRRTRGRR